MSAGLPSGSIAGLSSHPRAPLVQRCAALAPPAVAVLAQLRSFLSKLCANALSARLATFKASCCLAISQGACSHSTLPSLRLGELSVIAHALHTGASIASGFHLLNFRSNPWKWVLAPALVERVRFAISLSLSATQYHSLACLEVFGLLARPL